MIWKNSLNPTCATPTINIQMSQEYIQISGSNDLFIQTLSIAWLEY